MKYNTSQGKGGNMRGPETISCNTTCAKHVAQTGGTHVGETVSPPKKTVPKRNFPKEKGCFPRKNHLGKNRNIITERNPIRKTPES